MTWVVILVIVVAIVLAAAFAAMSGSAYDEIGKGGLSLDRDDAGAAGKPRPGERDEEIRQMLQARNARRSAQGRPEVDVEDELRRLTRPAADPGLEEEVRQLVVARNERRTARGEAPLDVDAEVARQLERLGE